MSEYSGAVEDLLREAAGLPHVPRALRARVLAEATQAHRRRAARRRKCRLACIAAMVVLVSGWGMSRLDLGEETWATDAARVNQAVPTNRDVATGHVFHRESDGSASAVVVAADVGQWAHVEAVFAYRQTQLDVLERPGDKGVYDQLVFACRGTQLDVLRGAL